MPWPKEQHQIILDLHKEIGHFSEGRTLAEVNQRYFWHNMTTVVKMMACIYKQCQLVKRIGNVKFEPKELKCILIWDQFYHVAFNTVSLLPKTKNGNMYILVAIDHYSKWCEFYLFNIVIDHDAKIVARCLEDGIISRFGVPKYVLMAMGQNGLLNSINYAKIMTFCINILHSNGQDVMEWWQDW